MRYESAVKGKRSTRAAISRFNVTIPPDLIERLDKFCLTHGYKRNHLIDAMLLEFLEKWGIDQVTDQL